MNFDSSALRIVRRYCGITQAELGRRVGMTGPYIAMIEKGKRHLSHDLAIILRKELPVSDADIMALTALASRSLSEC